MPLRPLHTYAPCLPLQNSFMLRYVSLTLIVASVVLAAPYFAFMCDGSRWEDVSMKGLGERGKGEGEGNRKAAKEDGEAVAARIPVTCKEVGLLRVLTEQGILLPCCKHVSAPQRQPAACGLSPCMQTRDPVA